MIDNVSKSIFGFLLNQGIILSANSEENDFIKYGIEITISSLLNIILVVTIGLIFHSFYESLIFLFCFMTLRTFTGGFHANTYFSCNLIFSLSFSCVLFLYHFTKQEMNVVQAALLSLFGIALIVVLSPISNKNKPLSKVQRRKFKFIGVLLGIAIGFAGTVLLFNGISYGVMVTYSLLLVAVFILMGKIKEWEGFHERKKQCN